MADDPNAVIRGGYGLFYNPNGNGGANLRLERTPPYGPIYLVTTGDLFPAQTFSQGLPAAPTVNLAAAANPSGGLIGVEGDFKNANARRPFYGINPNISDVTFSVSDGPSNYNSLQVSLDKRLTKGLTLLAGYTYSHAIDNVSTDFGGGTGAPQDPRYCNLDRSDSAFDMRQRFALS